jgi:hypothetical protein
MPINSIVACGLDGVAASRTLAVLSCWYFTQYREKAPKNWRRGFFPFACILVPMMTPITTPQRESAEIRALRARSG